MVRDFNSHFFLCCLFKPFSLLAVYKVLLSNTDGESFNWFLPCPSVIYGADSKGKNFNSLV